MSFESLLIHTCYFGIPGSSQNTLGEWKYSWSYITSGVKCRAVPITDRDRVSSPGRFDDVSYRMYFLPSETINLDYNIKYNSNYYRIVDLRFDSSSHHQQALLAGIQ